MLSLPPATYLASVGVTGAETCLSGYLSLADGRVLPVHHGFVIGRVAGCDLVIDDAKASRRHARLVVEAGVVEIEDLQSSNGTLLNGKPVTRRVLRNGDQVQIGKAVLTYQEGVAVRSGAGPAAVADDNDLFGEAPATQPPSTPPVAAPAVAAPAPAAPVARRPEPPPPASPPPPAPPAPPPPPSRSAVVEFADEVVEVRKPAAPVPAKPGGTGPAEPTVSKQQRVLQFSKQADRGGVLGDDLAQMSGGTRSLVYAVVLAAAAGLAWGITRLVG